MDGNLKEQVMSSDVSSIGVCSTCHQPILPQYYFCPNCGTKVNGKEVPLETNTTAQVKIYALSIIQPMVLFLFYTKWHGIKYFKSDDPKAHKIGQIAWALMIISTVVTVWLSCISYVAMTKAIESSLNSSMTTDFGM
jgi:DNA-directed RNA polymerase subunit RPC12/RpoP